MGKEAKFGYKDSPDRVHVEENAESYRNGFARDRDRVLYSKEFRRLDGKTQVFVSGFDDHVRNRLTHTLEVNQIAVTIGKALHLNLDLIEAIALVHDVGHTPFGHVGERYLNYLMNGCMDYASFDASNFSKLKGFKHNLQGARVVTTLEKISSKFSGINLSNEVITGMLYHTDIKQTKPCEYFINKGTEAYCMMNNVRRKCPIKGKFAYEFYDDLVAKYTKYTIEARVLALADEIAQRHHDIEDAIEANIINRNELLKALHKENIISDSEKLLFENEQTKEILLHDLSKAIISKYVNNIVDTTNKKFELSKKRSQEGILNYYAQEMFSKTFITLNIEEKIQLIENLVTLSNDFIKHDDALKKYLKNVILKSNITQKMDGKAQFLLRQIINAYIDNPQQLPLKTIHSVLLNYNALVKRIDKNLHDTTMSDLEDFLVKNESIISSGLINSELRDFLMKYHLEQSSAFKIALLRTISDYVSGMTDNYAIDLYESLYGISRKY